MRLRLATTALSVALLLASANSASAQLSDAAFDPEQFSFGADPRAVSWLDSASTLADFEYAVGLGFHLGGAPLEICVGEAGAACTSSDIVGDRFTADLALGFGLLDRFDFRVTMPVVLFQDHEFDAGNGADAPKSTGAGDLRLGAKARLYDSQGFRLAADLSFSLPLTGGSSFIGTDGTVVHPRAIAELRSGRLSTVAHAGYRYRQKAARIANLYVDDELTWAVGGEYELLPRRLAVGASLFGAIGLMSDDDPIAGTDGSPGAEEAPTELLFSARYWISDHIALEGGAGTGLTDAYGSPRYRVLAGLRWVNKVSRTRAQKLVSKILDSDGDGLVDDQDQCPQKPEDVDSFEDADGCPDPDNDKDGIADSKDTCPNQAEDQDGFEDDNGCPDLDNDKDGIADSKDACPNQAEDKDGFEDDNGCPDLDNDKDGIADSKDACPNQAEDKDGFEDDNGCPDLDNDKDGLVDSKDKCPDQAEVYNNVEDEDGCPDKGRVVAVLTATGITINQKIYFRTNKSALQPRSYKTLDVVVQVLKNHSSLRVRIEGHTDDRGKDAANLLLSQARAEAVKKYFVDKGVDASRLQAEGYGETRPIQEGRSRKARGLNRRVEFISVGAPETQPSASDTQPSAPDTQPSAPDTQPSAPDTQPSAPDTQPPAPDTQPPAPDTQPSAPDTQPSAPDSRP